MTNYKNQHWDGPYIRDGFFRSAHVYRPPYSKGMLMDATNGGITCYKNTAWLISLEMAEAETSWLEDTLVLVKFPNSEKVIAVPYGYHDKHHVYTQPGGNFIYSMDSRFPCRHPIEVRDRLEGQTAIRVCQKYGDTELVQVMTGITANHYERDNFLCALARHGRLKPGYFSAQIVERNELGPWDSWIVVEEKDLVLGDYTE